MCESSAWPLREEAYPFGTTVASGPSRSSAADVITAIRAACRSCQTSIVIYALWLLKGGHCTLLVEFLAADAGKYRYGLRHAAI